MALLSDSGAEPHFCLPLRESLEDLKRKSREFPGKDFVEGNLEFVHLDDVLVLDSLLQRQDWFAGGKASIMRTLEFLSVYAERCGTSMANMARQIEGLLNS
jgi:hypothetical protein